MGQWSDLPTELHLRIWEILIQEVISRRNNTPEYMRRYENPEGKFVLTRYASVAKVWRPIFEKAIFRQLTITNETVLQLGELTLYQQSLVEHIWLKIHLTKYECHDCLWDTPSLDCQNVDIVRDAIVDLFQSLHKWRQNRDPSSKRLTLEISAYSLSDLKHVFEFRAFFDTNMLADGELRLPRMPSGLEFMMRHTSAGSELYALTTNSIGRISGFLCPTTLPKLPPLKIVKRFIIRRQTRRRLCPQLLLAVFRSLPNLEDLHYEPWREFYRDDKRGYLHDIYHGKMIQLLPKTLRNLTFFEDFNEDFNKQFVEEHAFFVPTPTRTVDLLRRPDPYVGYKLAVRSLELENVSASYVVEARDFFKSATEDWIWHRLETLTLTTSIFNTTQWSPEVDRLLRSAAAVAAQMPVLRRMDIWHGSYRSAGGFRYEVTDEHAMIRFRATWHFVFGEDVITPWEKVAWLQTRHILTVCNTPAIDPKAITSHAVAIRWLGLDGIVVNSVSLKQIDEETRLYEKMS